MNNTPPAPLHFITRLAAIIAFAFAGIFAIPTAADEWQISYTEKRITTAQPVNWIGGKAGGLAGGTHRTSRIPPNSFYTTITLDAKEYDNRALFLDETRHPATITTTITAAIPPDEQVHVITIQAGITQTIIAPASPTVRTLTNVVATATAVFHLRRTDERGSWRAQWKAQYDMQHNPQTAIIAHSELVRDLRRGVASETFAPTRQTLDFYIGEKKRINEVARLGYALIESLGRGKLPDNRGQINRTADNIIKAVYEYRKSQTQTFLPPSRYYHTPYTNDTIPWIINHLKTQDFDGNIPADWANSLLKKWRER